MSTPPPRLDASAHRTAGWSEQYIVWGFFAFALLSETLSRLFDHFDVLPPLACNLMSVASIATIGAAVVFMVVRVCGYGMIAVVMVAAGLCMIFARLISVSAEIDAFAQVPLLSDTSPHQGLIRNLADIFGISAWILGFFLMAFEARRAHGVLTLEVERRRQSESALATRERQFSATFNQAGIPMAVIGLDGRIRQVNAAACALLGYTRAELEGRHFSMYTHPDDLDVTTRRFEDQVEGKSNFYQLEKRYLRKDGSFFWGLVTMSLARASNGQPDFFIGMIEDLTPRKEAEEGRQRLEAQVQHAQKLESLGVLAGGIAHDFNNLLVGILGYADLTLRLLPPEAAERRYQESIVASAQRAADLCSQLLAYSGRGQFVHRTFDLTQAVREMSHLLEASVSKKATLNYFLEQHLPAVEGDPTQVGQIVMNLITNASEALGDREGAITIVSGVNYCDKNFLNTTVLPENLKEGLYVYFEVSDTGSGMTEETLRRIFDPFFTTKASGRGLGLAAALGIIRKHRGTIHLASAPGEGTTVRVLFPAADAPPAPAAPAPVLDDSLRGTGTILVVDDEEAVRSVAGAIFERGGFDVIYACDGVEGVEQFRRHHAQLRGVLLDMTMPRMNGEETFREMHAIAPAVPVLLTSGYSEQDIAGTTLGQAAAGFIHKPYRLVNLLAAMRDAIEARGDGAA